MKLFQWKVLISDCIRFYEKRGWNWVPVVGYLCQKALGEMSDLDKAKAMAESLKGRSPNRRGASGSS